ncbi:unnamed protein product [Nezara viridula]|uniref:Uncharacterized protein n=1 Tax=Nezara viridula TaxID=85310 RepID=A0A9P0E8B7_NEZVI|nr:unnamed protein product [Nezara viridula]
MFCSIRTRNCEDACSKVTWGISTFGMLPVNGQFDVDFRRVVVSATVLSEEAQIPIHSLQLEDRGERSSRGWAAMVVGLTSSALLASAPPHHPSDNTAFAIGNLLLDGHAHRHIIHWRLCLSRLHFLRYDKILLISD